MTLNNPLETYKKYERNGKEREKMTHRGIELSPKSVDYDYNASS